MSELTSNPAEIPKHSLVRFALWFLLALLASLGLAWLSLQVQWAGAAPLVLFSFIVGATLGLTLVALARLTGSGMRRWMIASALLLSLLTAGMQHVFAYRAYVKGFHESVSNNPKAAMAKTFNPDFGPAGFWGYMRAEGRKQGYWLMWIVDAKLIVLTTLAILWFGLRRPHCAACHRWFHVGRTGVLPSNSAASTCAAVGITLPDDVSTTRFRLLECRCGCSPAQLEVSWSTASGSSGTALARPSVEQRLQLETALRPTNSATVAQL